MFVLIGFAVVFGSVLVGYIMHGGQVAALIQISEFIIIGGAAFGGVIIGNGMSGVQTLIKAVLGLLKPPPVSKSAYMELLQMLFAMFTLARKEGLLALERHVENPESSELFAQYPGITANHHAMEFLCDTVKVILTGAVGHYELSDLMEIDLETHKEEAMKPAHILSKTGDAMPGFGIVAAVLGVVITMQAINGPPEQIGHKVAAALVGTFLGVLMAYGIFQPLSQAVEGRMQAEEEYLQCIRHALLSFARGESPITCVEFARRQIPPTHRPSFREMEETVKDSGRQAAAA